MIKELTGFLSNEVMSDKGKDIKPQEGSEKIPVTANVFAFVTGSIRGKWQEEEEEKKNRNSKKIKQKK